MMIKKRVIELNCNGNSFQIPFIFCHPGKFRISNRILLGSKNAIVEFSKGFWLQEMTVSLGLYEFVYEQPYYDYTFSEEEKNLMPWDSMDFREVRKFLERINQKFKSDLQDQSVDVPTIAEWEHALLCGKDQVWSWGNEDDELGDYAWYCNNSNNSVHYSKQKKCNNWGLYDMYGNVHEYCYDVVFDAEDYYFFNPPKKEPNENDVLPSIGGAYDSTLEECSLFNVMGYNNEFIRPTGFRLVIR